MTGIIVSMLPSFPYKSMLEIDAATQDLKYTRFKAPIPRDDMAALESSEATPDDCPS
jgi:hypothetical protein